MSEAEERPEMFHVVVNDEEQYSIWPDNRELPPGWSAVAGPAPRARCLEIVKERWTDMRPLSLRRQQSEA
ncbi:MAG TPA: MbtH family NRPS accessory protein [Thermoanaerobaculia bacterium]